MRLTVGVTQKPKRDQDKLLVNSKQQLFAVFDGVGAFMDSGLAAQLAADTVEGAIIEPTKYLNAPPEAPLELLTAVLEECNRLIINEFIGATTAAVVHIIDNEMYYASVGDSRIYLKSKDKPIQQLVEDEGEGNIVDNWLGYSRRGNHFKGVRQLGNLQLGIDDKIVLCTDGITGDFHSDILSTEELENALNNDSPQISADQLVETSRKHDDKTAIVIYVQDNH